MIGMTDPSFFRPNSEKYNLIVPRLNIPCVIPKEYRLNHQNQLAEAGQIVEYPAPRAMLPSLKFTTLKGRRVVIKLYEIRRQPYPYEEESFDMLLEGLYKALDACRRLSHPNIADFLGLTESGHALPYLVLPWDNGPILPYIERNADVDRLQMICEIASALNYMHNLSPPVVHGELKCSNIIVNDRGCPQLVDVGTSTLGRQAVEPANRVRWLPLEVLYMPEDDPLGRTDTKVYDPAGEVWSFGMTCLELLTGRPPWSEHLHSRQVNLALCYKRRPLRPASGLISDEIWEMMRSCWQEDPESRPLTSFLYQFWLLQSNPLYTSVASNRSRDVLAVAG